MRERTEVAAGGVGQPSALRYIPATVAAVVATACLILFPSISSWTRPWFYAKFLESAGPPAASRLAVIITTDAEPGTADLAQGLEAEYLSHLSSALLDMGPKALALDLPASLSGSLTSETQGGATGAIVLGSDFRTLQASSGKTPEPEASGADKEPAGIPPVLARSLYPHLDGSRFLNLPQGRGLALPETQPWRMATAAFTGPLAAERPAFSFPAFARLERGVVAGLGVETARRMLGVPASGATLVEGVGVIFDPAHFLPLDADGNLHLRFHEPSGIPSFHASRILDGSVQAEEIRGKAVIVAGRGRPPVRTVAGYLSPAEIWATSVSNLLEKATISAPSWGRILAVAMGIAFSAIILAVHFADLGAFATLLLAALLASLYPILSLVLFVKSSFWLPPELPAFMVFAAYLPFGLSRLASPRRGRATAPTIRPAPVYDPLVAMGGGPGRPGQQAAQSIPQPGPAHLQATPSLMPPAPPLAPRQPIPAPQPRSTPPRGIPQTPARGTPQMPASAPQAGSFAPAPVDASRGKVPPNRERQGPIPPAPAAPPPQAGQPLQSFPGEASQQPASPAAEGFRDPRDPPLIASPAAPAAPAAQVATPRPSVAPPVMPHNHNGSISDEIERDAKGGLIRVGKYRIVRKMGFGSGGDVFEGFDTHMGRKVAIKTITKEAAAHFDRAQERFVVEAKAAGSLNHPCINTIYDFGSIRDVSYMVLEYLDGVTLSQWMRQNPVPSPRQVAPWIQQICSAMDYAHSQKVIHRDLKPANLMVVHNGATIKLLDFGIAKLEDVGLTQTGMTVGTPSYMSPEQLTGSKVTAASDQYGLAVVLYQLFTYKLPYQGTKIPELCNRILKNDLIPITDVNPALGTAFWEALRKAMSKAPEDRYSNCMALSQALESVFPEPQAAAPA